MSSKKVIIAGGGTGGHIYPGLAIASALKEIEPNIEIEFVGAKNGLEEKIIPKEGYKLHTVRLGRLNNNVSKKERILTLLLLPLAILKSFYWCLLWRPKAVLGVGGFASAPFVLAASLLGRRTAIWEPNAHPGLANRWLTPFVKMRFTVFAAASEFMRGEVLGLPVRSQMQGLKIKEKTEFFHILVFGGSQGARTLNYVLSDALLESPESFEGIKLVHQTGAGDFEEIVGRYQRLSSSLKERIECHEFLHDMNKRYEWADLVICRGGASTVAELAACQKAAVIVPYPYAADNHQQKNAEELVREGAAGMLLNSELNKESLIAKIQELKQGSEQRQLWQANIQKFYRPKAAEEIAKRVLGV